jgi:hypothetical protein
MRTEIAAFLRAAAVCAVFMPLVHQERLGTFFGSTGYAR